MKAKREAGELEEDDVKVKIDKPITLEELREKRESQL